MNDNRDNLRRGLLSQEHVNSDLETKYRKEMEKMFTEEITGVKKLGWWARDLVLLLLGIAFISCALFNWPLSVPGGGRWLWGLSGVFTLGIAMVELNIARKKKMDLRRDSGLIAKFGFAGMFVIANVFLFMGLLGGNVKDMVMIAPMVMLMMIIGILLLVENRVRQSELNIREKLLEIQYSLAALAESQKKDSGPKA